MKINNLLIICLQLLVFGSLYAQNAGNISGNITTDENEPLISANVILKELQKGTFTNEQGTFTIENIEQGQYTLVVSAIGYVTKEQSITVTTGETSFVNLSCETNALELESIIITAEKREDELQNVPISVSSVGSKKVAGLQISNSNEIGRITPNFRTYDDGGGSFPLVSTRGIITIDNTPVVGMYIDDVPLFNTISFPSYIGDIDRIEVLKGPQGTLYGRNSIGGVINIITKKPANNTKGFVTAGYGNLNQYDVQAGISAPIAKDKLFLRFNGGLTGRDGYIENMFLNNTDLLSRKAYSANGKITYWANDQWTFKLNSGYERREVNAYAFIGGFGATAQAVENTVNNTPYQVNQNTNGLYTTNISNNAFKASFTNDKIKFDAITAYQKTKLNRENDDFDFSPADIQEVVSDKTDFSTISQEIRISSNRDSRLNWIGGLYLYSVSNKSNARRRNGVDNAFNPQLPADAAAQYPYDQIARNEVNQNGFSIFGQASYQLREKLTATLGLRYEIENSNLNVTNSFEKDGQNFIYPLLGVGPAEFDKSTQFDAFSPKANLAYQATENSLLFVNVTRGYRPGGVNEFVLDEAKATFNPEFSWNYEVGVKNKLWNNRAKLNANIFYIDYKDQQLYNVIDLTTFSIGRENIGNSRSIGAELETEVVLTKGLNFTGNLGYLQTEFIDYTYIGFTGMPIDNKGNEQVMSPQWSGNVGLNYAMDITEDWKGSIVLDYQYQSDVFFDPENTAKQEAYGLLNGRVVIEKSKRFEFALWGKNITDATYLSYGYSVSGAGIFASYGLPRTFGTSITAKF